MTERRFPPSDQERFDKATAEVKHYLKESFPALDVDAPLHNFDRMTWLFLVCKDNGAPQYRLEVPETRLVDAGLPPLGQDLATQRIAEKMRSTGMRDPIVRLSLPYVRS